MYLKLFRPEILRSGFRPVLSPGWFGKWYVKKHYAFRPFRCACCKKWLWFEPVVSDYVDNAYGAEPKRITTYSIKHAVKEKLAERKL